MLFFYSQPHNVNHYAMAGTLTGCQFSVDRRLQKQEKRSMPF